MTDHKHPPTDKRCQIYITAAPGSRDVLRCSRDGDHWVKWGGCGCDPQEVGLCEDDFFSWECDGNHLLEGVQHAA
jgi:hypothetical protein